MKLTFFMVMFAAAFSVFAQNYPTMDPQKMQEMMQKAQKVQACMANIDEDEMKVFQKKAEKMQAEIDALCKAGKRDEAMSKAMAMGKEISQDPTLQKMKKCGEIMQGMMSNLPEIAKTHEGGKAKHICD